MISDFTYAHINPNSPIVCPEHPVPLAQIQNLTQYQIAETFHLHTESLRIINLFNIVECTIIHNINGEVYNECLVYQIYKETGALEVTDPEIVKNLFETYSDIISQTLSNRKSKFKGTPYDHKKSLNILLQAISE